MKQIKDFAVSSQEAGFDEFLLIWNEHFKYGLIGLYEYYGCIQNLPSIWTTKAHVDAPIITPQEAIALLTGKQLTEGDFAHVSEHQSAMEYLQTPSLKEMESQPKLLPTQESVKEIDTFIADHDKLSLKMANEEVAHLQQQLKEAKELLLEAELIFRKHAIVSCTRVSINQFLTSNQ